MTKIVKWYKRMSFWQAILMVVAPLSVGGELALYFTGAHPVFFWIIGIAAAISIYIKTFFKDDNNNGIVDFMERPKK